MAGTDSIYVGDDDLRISNSPGGIDTRKQSNIYEEIIDEIINGTSNNSLLSQGQSILD